MSRETSPETSPEAKPSMGWLSRRWSVLDARPVTHAGVPGTGTLAFVAGAAGLARVLWGQPARQELPAAAVTVLGLAVAAAGLYHLVARLGLRRGGRLLVVAMLLVNPSVLGSALDPRVAVLLAGSFAALAGLVRWVGAARTPSGGDLAVYTGLPLTAAVFTGYEGWALAGAAAIVVIGHQVRRRQGVLAALRLAASLLVAPATIGGWWVLREALRGRAPESVLPALTPLLPPEVALALGCLLGALPVLVAMRLVVRRELDRATLAQTLSQALPRSGPQSLPDASGGRDLRLVDAPSLVSTSLPIGPGA